MRKSCCRLRFIFGLIALLSASLALAAPEPRVLENGPTTAGLVEWHLSQYDKINYPDTPKPLPQDLEALFKRLLQFQAQQMKDWGMNPFPDNPAPITWEESEKRKASFWEEVRKVLPERNFPAYSVKDYEHFLAWDIPRLCAPYGIFVRPTYKFQGNLSKPYLKVFEGVVAFYPIATIERETVTRWGKTFRRDMAWIKEPLWLEDYPELQKSFQPSAGQAYYQTVFLYRPGIEKVTWEKLAEEERRKREELIPKLEKLRQEDVTERVLKAKDPEAAAVEYAYLKATYDKLRPAETFEDEKARVIEHESRHAQDQMDIEYRKTFMPVLTSLVVEHLKSDNTSRVHFEANGGLSELRYAPRKDEPIRRLLLLKRNSGRRQDFSHDTAGRWTLAQMTELVVKNPARYGVKINLALALSAESQFLLQLPDLSNDQIERLAEDVMTLHQQRYSEDFGEEYIKSLRSSKSSAASTRRQMIGSIRVLSVAYRLRPVGFLYRGEILT